MRLVIGAALGFAEAGRDREGTAGVAAACEAAVRGLDPSGRGGGV